MKTRNQIAHEQRIALIAAARLVVANWSSGDLAGAVNQLEEALGKSADTLNEISNEMRADWARLTMQAYAEIRDSDQDDYEANVTDLMTDLRHEFARWNMDIDLEACARMSAMHFEAERHE